jgi:hypothetical protein
MAVLVSSRNTNRDRSHEALPGASTFGRDVGAILLGGSYRK